MSLVQKKKKTAPNEIYLVKPAQSFQYGLNNIRWIVFNKIKSALFAPKYQYWKAIVLLRFYVLLVHTVDHHQLKVYAPHLSTLKMN